MLKLYYISLKCYLVYALMKTLFTFNFIFHLEYLFKESQLPQDYLDT